MLNLPFTNADLIGMLFRSVITVACRRLIEQAPKSKNHIKEGKKSVVLISEVLRGNIINPVELLVEGRLVYKSQ